MLETQGPPKEGVDMGYSDEPLSEHSLTGTRIRPLIKKNTTRGTREGGKRGAATSVCDKNTDADKCAVHKFRRPTKSYTHVTTSYQHFKKKHFKHYSTTPNCAVRAI